MLRKIYLCVRNCEIGSNIFTFRFSCVFRMSNSPRHGRFRFATRRNRFASNSCGWIEGPGAVIPLDLMERGNRGEGLRGGTTSPSG